MRWITVGHLRNIENLISFCRTFIPCNSVLEFICLERSSNARLNKRGERGQPWLVPFCSGIGRDKAPKVRIFVVGYTYMFLRKNNAFLWKPMCSNTTNNHCIFPLSNSFSVSKDIIAMSVLGCCLACSSTIITLHMSAACPLTKPCWERWSSCGRICAIRVVCIWDRNF